MKVFLTPLQKLPENVGDLGQKIVATGFEKLPKCNNSPNLATLTTGDDTANRADRDGVGRLLEAGSSEVLHRRQRLCLRQGACKLYPLP